MTDKQECGLQMLSSFDVQKAQSHGFGIFIVCFQQMIEDGLRVYMCVRVRACLFVCFVLRVWQSRFNLPLSV